MTGQRVEPPPPLRRLLSSTPSSSKKSQGEGGKDKGSLLQRLKDAGVEVPVQRKIVGINFDLLSRLYWPGDEHMSDEEMEQFAQMPPRILYDGITDPRSTGFPKLGGSGGEGTDGSLSGGGLGHGTEHDNDAWEKWINAEGDEEWEVPSMDGVTGKEKSGKKETTGPKGGDNASGSSGGPDSRGWEGVAGEGANKHSEFEALADAIDDQIRWEVVEDDSPFGIYVPDRFKDDMLRLWRDHDWTTFELATVYSISEVRVKAILLHKQREEERLPELIEEQPDVATMFGLGAKLKAKAAAATEAAAAAGEASKDEGVEESDDKRGGEIEDEEGEGGEEEEDHDEEGSGARGVRLPRYTGEEIETEMTALFYENPFVFKHVPIAFHKRAGGGVGVDDEQDMGLEEEEYPLREDGNVITLHDGETLEGRVSEMAVDRTKPQVGGPVVEGQSLGRVSLVQKKTKTKKQKNYKHICGGRWCWDGRERPRIESCKKGRRA